MPVVAHREITLTKREPGSCTCRQADKHPGTQKGLKNAAVDTGQIRDWGSRPDANISIVIGSTSGWVVVVIDIDDKIDGQGNANFETVSI